MAADKKKARAGETEQGKATTDYYRLNTQAVDDLVNASEENSPEVSQEEINKYKSRAGRFKLPEWLKAVLIKLWFAGAVCFFILWGLGMYIPSQLDMFFVLGVALGIVTDLLVNNLFRFYEETPGANDRWMMFPKKKFSTFFLNILYSFVILFAVYMVYNVINFAIISITGVENTIPLGVEPVLFGTLCMAFDMLFIGMKNTFKRIVSDARQSVSGQKK